MTRLIPALLLLAAATARAEEIDYKKLYAATSPAVVLIYGEEGEVGSLGTGSILHKSGLVITNAHVILSHTTGKPFEKLFIFLKPDRITGQNEQDLKRGFQAKWLSYNPALDLALLAMVNPPDDLPTLGLAGADVGVGEATAAIGHPEHGAKWSLTTGRIGGEFADFEGVKGKDVYQMETSVNRGNSGGPLIDGNGYMVGINTSIARKSEDGLAITGVNFAIKSSVVRDWLAETFKDNEARVSKEKGEAPPAPEQVAKAEPAPLAPERTAANPAPEKHDEVATGARKGDKAGAAPEGKSGADAAPEGKPGAAPEGKSIAIAQPLPAAPPAGKRGYKSQEPPGRVLSPQEVVKLHAKKAFDDLDRMDQQHEMKKNGR